MKRIALIMISLVILAATIVYFENLPDFRGDYKNLEQARNDKHSNGSWKTPFLPKAATDIHVEYTLSPDTYRLEFQFSPADKDALLDFFELVDDSKKDTILTQLKDHWWSSWETEISDSVVIYKSKVKENGFDYSKIIFMAIDTKSGKAWCESLWVIK